MMKPEMGREKKKRGWKRQVAGEVVLGVELLSPHDWPAY